MHFLSVLSVCSKWYVFWPANGCFSSCSLVNINFFSVFILFLTNVRKKEGMWEKAEKTRKSSNQLCVYKIWHYYNLQQEERHTSCFEYHISTITHWIKISNFMLKLSILLKLVLNGNVEGFFMFVVSSALY